jgi:hypothetical protein
MLRFLFFLGGIVAGFMAAIFLLPLPGKTFFNRMSRLPNGVKNLIDNGLDLGNAFLKIGLTIYKELRFGVSLGINKSKKSVNKLRERFQNQQNSWKEAKFPPKKIKEVNTNDV